MDAHVHTVSVAFSIRCSTEANHTRLPIQKIAAATNAAIKAKIITPSSVA